MNTKKLKLLSATHFIKVSLPLAVLFCVFFLKSMIESAVNNTVTDKFSNMLKAFDVSIPKEDLRFIDALKKGDSPKIIEPYNLSVYITSPVINGFYNNIQPAETVPEQQPAEQNGMAQEDQPVTVPFYDVTAVMNGVNKKCAVINGKLINLGDSIDETGRLAAIEDTKILVEGIWGKKWYYVRY